MTDSKSQTVSYKLPIRIFQNDILIYMKYILFILISAALFFGLTNKTLLEKIKGVTDQSVSVEEKATPVQEVTTETTTALPVENTVDSNFKEAYLGCTVGSKGSFSIVDEPFFMGTLSLTADYEILKKENDICTIAYSNYRDVAVAQEGVVNQEIAKNMNDSYKTMKITCRLSKEDREKSFQQSTPGNFSFSYSSSDSEKCEIEGIE